MSNRPRRRLLWEWRRWAVIAEYAAYDWRIPDIQTRQDEERWIRTEFRLIQRELLQLPSGKGTDDGLVNIQARNRLDRLNLLENGFPDDFPNSPIRHELIDDFEAAARLFYDALDRLKPLKRVCRQRFDWASWADRAFTDGLWRRPTGKPDPTLFMLEAREEWADYTAPMQWVAKAVAGQGHCLHQHAEAYGPIHAAQTCLQNRSRLSRSLFLPKELLGYWMRVHPQWLDKLKDAEILFLLAANEARQAGECLVALAQAMREESEAAGIDPEDEKALEQLRGRIAAWERQERHYCAGKLATAKEWLLLGDKEAQKQEAKADSHKAVSAGGGRHPKKSVGIQKLADSLRKERGATASPNALFNLAAARCLADGAIEISGYRITLTPDGKLVSHAADGSPDRQPVDSEAWRKNYLGRKR